MDLLSPANVFDAVRDLTLPATLHLTEPHQPLSSALSLAFFPRHYAEPHQPLFEPVALLSAVC